MHQSTNKKIFIYLFLFFFVGTVNNINLKKMVNPKIENINIYGLSTIEAIELSNKLEFLKLENLYSIESAKIQNILEINNFIEDYSLFKKYPSTLEINVVKTKILANVNIGENTFFIGSNGKLIKTDKKNKDFPLIKGKLDINEFLKFKKVIDNSEFDYKKIMYLTFFHSKRWDIELKNGIKIRLPQNQVEEALKLLVKILKKNDFKNFLIIDMRVNNQVIFDE